LRKPGYYKSESEFTVANKVTRDLFLELKTNKLSDGKRGGGWESLE